MSIQGTTMVGCKERLLGINNFPVKVATSSTWHLCLKSILPDKNQNFGDVLLKSEYGDWKISRVKGQLDIA